jgi:hypothetical protein
LEAAALRPDHLAACRAHLYFQKPVFIHIGRIDLIVLVIHERPVIFIKVQFLQSFSGVDWYELIVSEISLKLV